MWMIIAEKIASHLRAHSRSVSFWRAVHAGLRGEWHGGEKQNFRHVERRARARQGRSLTDGCITHRRFPSTPSASPRRYSCPPPPATATPALPLYRPFHRSHLPSAPAQRAAETGQITTTADVRGNRPAFHAPALPPPRQRGGDRPCSLNFRPKDRAVCKSASQNLFFPALHGTFPHRRGQPSHHANPGSLHPPADRHRAARLGACHLPRGRDVAPPRAPHLQGSAAERASAARRRRRSRRRTSPRAPPRRLIFAHRAGRTTGLFFARFALRPSRTGPLLGSGPLDQDARLRSDRAHSSLPRLPRPAPPRNPPPPPPRSTCSCAPNVCAPPAKVRSTAAPSPRSSPRFRRHHARRRSRRHGLDPGSRHGRGQRRSPRHPLALCPSPGAVRAHSCAVAGFTLVSGATGLRSASATGFFSPSVNPPTVCSRRWGSRP